MKLSRKIIKHSKNYKTPFLLIDLKKIRENYRNIEKAFPDIEIFYAMKANDSPEILKVLAKEGSSFEVSSLNELKSLIRLNIEPKRIMCLNSIKSIEFLKYMSKVGISIMAYDSLTEVDKIAQYAPGSILILRVNVSNEGSDWPLTRKFGIDAVEALPYLIYAKNKGLIPGGVTFHVGSQCLNKNNWANALYTCDEIWKQAKNEGINLNILSLGGGLPTQHLKKIPTIKEISDPTLKALKRNFKTAEGRLRVTIEPGRGLVGDAAIMVASVLGSAKRGTEDWLYIDVGVFNGFMETIEGFAYEMKTEIGRKKKIVTIAGPSCDSVDVPFKGVQLSEVKIGERIYFINTGAYTTVYAASFNGFEIPKILFLN